MFIIIGLRRKDIKMEDKKIKRQNIIQKRRSGRDSNPRPHA